MATSVADIGPLIQSKIASLLIDPLFQQASTFLSLGVRSFQTSVPLSIPTISGHYSPGFVAENALIPTADAVDFDSVKLMPSTMESLKLITTVSQESLRQSSQSLDSILQARLTADVADKIDSQAWGATGDGITQPKGFQAWTGLQEVAITADVDGLLDLQAAALASNIPPGSLKFVMSPATFSSLRKLKDNTGNYLVQPDVRQGAGFVLLGTGITLTSKLPDDQVVLLDPQAVAVAIDENPRVEILRERYADYDQVGIKIVARIDWAPVAPNSIIVGTVG